MSVQVSSAVYSSFDARRAAWIECGRQHDLAALLVAIFFGLAAGAL